VDDYSSVAFWYQTEPHKAWSPVPPAEERLPRERGVPEQVLEGEALAPTAMPVGGKIEVQPLGRDWHGHEGALLVFKPMEQLGSVTLYVPLSEPGEYEISAYLSRGPENGIWRLLADGEPLGQEVDTYAASAGDEGRWPRTTFGVISRAAGVHRLEFTCVGKNPDSAGFMLGIDALHLRKI